MAHVFDQTLAQGGHAARARLGFPQKFLGAARVLHGAHNTVNTHVLSVLKICKQRAPLLSPHPAACNVPHGSTVACFECIQQALTPWQIALRLVRVMCAVIASPPDQILRTSAHHGHSDDGLDFILDFRAAAGRNVIRCIMTGAWLRAWCWAMV